MIELVVTVCSILHGAHCREVSLTFAELSLMQCQIGVGAQMQIMEWGRAHPNWRVERYRCQIPGTFAKL
jgi:hypothetical protein